MIYSDTILKLLFLSGLRFTLCSAFDALLRSGLAILLQILYKWYLMDCCIIIIENKLNYC